METIEERAWKKYPEVIKHHNLAQIDINEEKRRMYIEISTEQKAIDDELLKRVHKGVLDKAIKEKKELIDNAWQWMVDWVFENAPHEVFDELMSSREDYIKAMEE